MSKRAQYCAKSIFYISVLIKFILHFFCHYIIIKVLIIVETPLKYNKFQIFNIGLFMKIDANKNLKPYAPNLLQANL